MAIFRLHIPVLDEVKRKGLRTALNDKWVDVVTRVTAGLSPTDVRGVLRDDPDAPRPGRDS